MIRMFCDVCGAQIDVSAASKRIVRALMGCKVEVLVGTYQGAWNAGHFCEPCVLKTVAEGVSIQKIDVEP